MIEPILRFLSKVNKNGPIPINPTKPLKNRCWQWLAGKNHQGYGKFREGGRGSKTLHAHIFAYKYYFGAIPNKLQLDHLCHNKSCCNPTHLEPVTGSENVFRGPNKNREKTRCANGHPYSIENTAFTYNKYNRKTRHCKICK